jgi:hypothetical protein
MKSQISNHPICPTKFRVRANSRSHSHNPLARTEDITRFMETGPLFSNALYSVLPLVPLGSHLFFPTRFRTIPDSRSPSAIACTDCRSVFYGNRTIIQQRAVLCTAFRVSRSLFCPCSNGLPFYSWPWSPSSCCYSYILILR